ncbi:aldehyde dehydrogenase family protein [Variovorax sp. RT4R15]|uniref:aldehyde dehydrogenase family protein n=1 Tax=Variovorax sp. RT4R15 TaxID=3443737 RepID=UPI003F449269
MQTISMLIGGEQCNARSGRTFYRRNPLDGQQATTAPAASADDARAAVDAAAKAFVCWSQTRSRLYKRRPCRTAS